MLKSKDVQFYWAIAAASIEQEEERILLKMIATLWITVQGFSYTSSWIEQFNQEK